MAQDKNIKMSLQLVERLTDHSIQFIPLIDIASVPAQSGAQYAVIDTVTGKSPEGLRVKRRGSSLLVETEDDLVLVEIVDFYEEADAVFIPQAELEGTALAGEFVTSSTPAIDTAANGDELIWQGNSGGELLTPTYLGLGGLALGGLAIAASGGGGSSVGADTDTGESPTVLNTVTGVIVGGPVIEGNDLRVEVYQADGVTKLGEAQVNPDGSFSIAVGSYLGVVIARVVNGGSGADYLDEATQVGKDLNAELFAMEVVTEPNSTVNVNLNVLSTLAYYKVQAEASNGAPTGPMVESINKGIADLFGLPSLHGLEVVPTNGGRFNSDDGLSSEEMYGALLAALSGADAQNGGDSQQTINDLLAGLTVSNGTAELSESAQGILVQGGAFTSAQTGDDLTGAVSGVVDTFAPDITSGAMASAIDENSGVRQVVYTAAASDAGNNIVYSLKSVGDHTLFSINAATGAVTLTGNPDHEGKASYSFTVVATDAVGNASEQAVSLGINNLDDTAPSINSGATASAIDENSGAGQVVYTVTSTDNADVVTGSTRYSLKAGDDSVLFSINASTGAVTLTSNPDYETKPNYSFTVVATDAAGNVSEQTVTLDITNLDDTAPSITSATKATTINENSGAGQVVYTATSTDNADIATGSTRYSLKAVGDHTLLSINASTGAVTLLGNPDHESKANYSFTIVATDAAGNASEQAVSFGINNLDEVAPTITSATKASTINENSGAGQVVYTATSTDNADVATGATRYSLKAVGDHTLLSINANTGAVTLIGNPDFETKASYSFTVVATDAAGNASEQSVSFGINNLDDTAPIITSGGTASAINENSGAGQVVYTATSTDNTDVVTGSTRYSLKTDGDAALFTIDASTGAVTLTSNPDFETKPSYSFTVVATDAAGNASEQAVTLGITNLDDTAPILTSRTTATAIAENSGAGQVVYTVTSSDSADISTGSTRYSLQAGGDAALFTINSTTGEVTLIGNPDFETKASYRFTVVATDAANNGSEQTVTLAINDLVDEVAPTVSSVAISSASGAQNNTLNAGDVVSVTVTMDEDTLVNTTNGTPRVALTIGSSTVYADYVSGSGGSTLVFQYTILADQTDLSGIAIPANALETNGGTVRDVAGNAAVLAHGAVADNAGFLVDTTAPSFSSGATAAAIDENSGAGRNIYTAAASDIGGVTYSLRAVDDHALLTINPGTGEVTLIGNPDFETKPNYNFTVVATDAAGNASEQAVTLAVNDLDEVSPMVSSVALTSASGAQGSLLNAGDVVSVTVTMDENTLVTGTPRVALLIGSTTVYADYVSGSGGTALVFNYVIQANQTDANGIAIPLNALELHGGTLKDATGNDAVLIHGAIDDNASYQVDTTAPSVISGAAATAINENSGAGQTVYTAVATDANTVSYSLKTVDDHAAFSIDSASGTVTLNGNPDFETKNSYAFTVIATDAAGNASEQAVALSINDVDDTGPVVSSVALTSTSGAQNNTLNAGDVVSVTVGMNEATLVNIAGGTPRIALTVGGSTVYADYVSGSGTASLVFQYTILAGQTDANGIAIPANGLALNGGTFKDTAGNDAIIAHALVADNGSFRVDTTAPTLSSSTPIDGTTAVAVGNNIVLTFNELVQAGSGNIVISNGTDTRTISVNDNSQVSISGSMVTINPTADLNAGSSYHVQMGSGVLTDQAGNAYAGINDPTTLNFETAAGDSRVEVVFDLVNGHSSTDNGGRVFNGALSYDIYIRVDSDSRTLNTSGDWAIWTGGANLGADDRIILVGDGTPVLGRLGGEVTNVRGGSTAISWISASGFAGIVSSLAVPAGPLGGGFARFAQGNNVNVKLVDTWAAAFLGGQEFALGTMYGPGTSQGLAGPV